MNLARLFAQSKDVWRRMCQRGIKYWVRLFVTVLLVNQAASWTSRREVWKEYRYKFYQFLQQTNPRKASDRNTVVVLIGDEEYWKGELARRVPIKREYLEKLVCRLDAADAKVIALDFDFRSPTYDGNPVESPDYRNETDQLLQTIKVVSLRRPVVLPKTIWLEDDEYITDSDIYDDFSFGNGNVSKGYIALPYDQRRVPLRIELKSGTPMDSFALAVATAFRTRVATTLPRSNDAPYGSFLKNDEFISITAERVLSDDLHRLRDEINGQIVIVGGVWSRFAYKRGEPTDSHFTPVGWTQGVFLHANYVEAILDSRVYPPAQEGSLLTVEWILVGAMVITFAAGTEGNLRIGLIVSCWLALLALSYISFMNFGIIFDLFVPALSVTLHWAAEHGWETFRSKARGAKEGLR
jgi:CHASE2 domain-containing sensor protein